MLEWYENLTDDEIPPQWMWPFSDELERWFAQVQADREARFGGGGDNSGHEIRNEYVR